MSVLLAKADPEITMHDNGYCSMYMTLTKSGHTMLDPLQTAEDGLRFELY